MRPLLTLWRVREEPALADLSLVLKARYGVIGVTVRKYRAIAPLLRPCLRRAESGVELPSKSAAGRSIAVAPLAVSPCSLRMV
jgi:hypothetical protein